MHTHGGCVFVSAAGFAKKPATLLYGDNLQNECPALLSMRRKFLSGSFRGGKTGNNNNKK